MSRSWGAPMDFGIGDVEIGRQTSAMLDYAKAVAEMVENQFASFYARREARPAVYELLLHAFLMDDGWTVPKALLLTTKTTQGGYPYVRDFLSDTPSDEDVVLTLERFVRRLASGEVVVP